MEQRLIDANKLEPDTEWDEYDDGYVSYSQIQIDNAPTVDAVPVVHGHWICYPECGVTRCSNCDWSIEEAWKSNFCPNCGAKMDEVSK